MSIYRFPSHFKKLPNNKNVKNWLNTIKNVKTERLKLINLERNKYNIGYGFYGEHIMNNIFFETNCNLDMYKDYTIKRPINKYLSMVDFMLEYDFGVRKPIEVKTFLSHEKDNNNISLIFNEKYFYMPSDIYLVELNLKRNLERIHFLEGREWTNYSLLANRFHNCNEFKNKVSIQVDLSNFDNYSL